jgi:c-di-GMP-binding flagellar brake protein YcgR
MKIEVGTKFLIEFPGTTEKMPTFLVGFEKDGYFIVKIPPIPGIRGRLREGNRVVCRFLHQGAIVSFRTEVLMMAQKPAPLLFLTYPFGFESHLVRQHQRVNCYFPAQALVQECRFPGLIMDISSGGCRIVCDDGSDKLPCPLSAGQDIAIEFHLLDRTRRYVLTGRIVNLTPEDRRTSIGISFDEADAPTGEVRALLQSYLDDVREALRDLHP